MPPSPPDDLSRRERQIMEILHARGESSVSDIVAHLPDPPSHTSVRTFLRILEEKRCVRRRRDGKRNLFRTTGSRVKAARAALGRVLEVFFDDSIENAISTHLADPRTRIDPEELERLSDLIQQAKKNKNKKKKKRS